MLAEQAAADAAATAASAETEHAAILERTAGEAASLQAELAAIHSSRAWRLAARYWSWRERVLPSLGRRKIRA